MGTNEVGAAPDPLRGCASFFQQMPRRCWGRCDPCEGEVEAVIVEWSGPVPFWYCQAAIKRDMDRHFTVERVEFAIGGAP